MRKRTRARELALQALYQLDQRGCEALELVDRLIDEGTAEPVVRLFARQLVEGCWSHREQLDAQIAAAAENWEIRRMAVVDRNVLRLAAFELLFLDDVPPKVAINEAVDLAKRYSTAESGAFVNGILDHIRLDRQRAAGAEGP
ncbi:MAG: transcription antitermination factor NusB [Candidatus Brocadiia bacterium]